MNCPPKIAELLEQALDYTNSNQFARAAAIIARVLQGDSGNASALYLRVFCLRRLGRLDEAEKAAEEALKLLPHDVALLIERGFVAYYREEYQKAIEFFEAALKREPKNVDGLKWKVTSLRALRRF